MAAKKTGDGDAGKRADNPPWSEDTGLRAKLIKRFRRGDAEDLFADAMVAALEANRRSGIREPEAFLYDLMKKGASKRDGASQRASAKADEVAFDVETRRAEADEPRQKPRRFGKVAGKVLRTELAAFIESTNTLGWPTFRLAPDIHWRLPGLLKRLMRYKSLARLLKGLTVPTLESLEQAEALHAALDGERWIESEDTVHKSRLSGVGRPENVDKLPMARTGGVSAAFRRKRRAHARAFVREALALAGFDRSGLNLVDGADRKKRSALRRKLSEAMEQARSASGAPVAD